jgi:hypothetical protein
LYADARGVTSGPSPTGVEELRRAAAALGHQPREPRRRRWPKALTAKRIALLLVADLTLGTLAFHYLTRSHPAAEAAAVIAAADAAAHNDWNGVYDDLCSSDRTQLSEGELQTAGRGALLSIGGLDHVTVTSVHSVALPVGPIHWPAAQVSGQLIPVVGAPSTYTVTVIREIGGWRMCLSAGGYRSSAMNVDVPLANG